jgi:S1-C subfamily serine protease
MVKICNKCHDFLDRKVDELLNTTKQEDGEQLERKSSCIEINLPELLHNTNNTEHNKNVDKHEKINLYTLKDATCSVTSQYADSFLLGSGFFIKHDRYYIVTCGHIVGKNPNSDEKNPKKIYIDVQNVNCEYGKHRQVICEIVGIDFVADIAVLRPLSLEENHDEGFNFINHPYLKFSSSTKTKQGSKCYIIGNSLGTDPFSVADGVVRDNKFVFDLPTESMLISAPAWSGNSGSPILDENGNVIGIVCYSYSSENEFSSTMVGGATQYMMEKIVKKIIETGENNTTKGYIGIKSFTTISDTILIILRQMFPDFNIGELDILKGLVVLDVEEPASNSTNPIKPLDIITEIRDPIKNKKLNLGCLDDQYHFSRISWFQKIGYPVEITVVRPLDNSTFNTVITVAQYPSEFDNLFGLSKNNTHKTIKSLGMKNYKLATLADYVKTRDLFDLL